MLSMATSLYETTNTYELRSNVTYVTIRVCRSAYHQKKFQNRSEITLSELLLLCSLDNRVRTIYVYDYLPGNKHIVLDLVGTSSNDTGFHMYAMKVVEDVRTIKMRMCTTRLDTLLSSASVSTAKLLRLCTKSSDRKVCSMKLISYEEETKDLYIKVVE